MFDLSTDYLALVLVLILLWEYSFPRDVIKNITSRWLNNFSLYVFNLIIKWVITVLLSFIALENFPIVDQYSLWFFLTNKVNLQAYLLITFVLFDLFFYCLHRLFHRYQYLWRLHLVHHSDVELDVTTNFRHHPLEQLLTSFIIALFIWLGQFTIDAVMLYGAFAAIIQIWHHGNISLPTKIEYLLGWLIITPSIHQLHHSTKRKETDSNYGSVFSVWDRLFNSLSTPITINGRRDIKQGLEYFREPQQQKLWQTLKQPFEYSLNNIGSQKEGK